jgi:hypothetical protein
MTLTRTVAVAAAAAALALTVQALDLLALGRGTAGQLAVMQSRLVGYQLTFLITQNPRALAPATNDQLTIIFASRSVEGPRPPKPFFGDDIVHEFSFSGLDFVNNQLRFTRRVNDKSFLEARYIRVVNYGGDGWAGDQISLTVDGQEILRNVPMTPHLGSDPSKGLQNFNPRDWNGRSYWEAELSRVRFYGK